MSKTHVNSMNSGELSQKLQGRTDIAKYYSGCQELLNLIPQPFGGVDRRPGTRFINEVKDSDDQARVIDFEYSTIQTYVLEFGNLYFRVYKESGQVQDGGNPVEVVTPYLANQLDLIQYAQSADIMFSVNGLNNVQQLTRSSHTDWTMEDLLYDDGPFLKENKTDTSVYSSDLSGSVTLTASAAIFQAGHVGSLFKLVHPRPITSVQQEFHHTDTLTPSDPIMCDGQWTIVTHKTWAGTLLLERSYDDGSTWKTVLTLTSENDKNYLATGTEPDVDVLYRMNMIDLSINEISMSLHVEDKGLTGVMRITAFTSPTVVTATTLRDIGNSGVASATRSWFEGSWSSVRGFPKSVTFHGGRIWYGGTDYQPQTFWGSVSNDFASMRIGKLPSDAMIIPVPYYGTLYLSNWLYGMDKLISQKYTR